MNWSDERYVKLYSRNTATWVTWPWQARAALPLFLRVADGAGLLDCGRREPLRALAALVMLPVEVVEVAVAAMVDDGTLEVVERGWLLPHYLEAQEATKTPALKKRDQRDRDRAKAREISMVPVTNSHQASPVVTKCPPPAQPSPPPPPAQPIPAGRSATPPKTKPTTDPTWQPLVDALDELWERIKGTRYSWSPADFAALKALRRRAEDQEIAQRWVRGLRGSYAREVNSVAQLASGSKWNALSTDAPAGFDPNQGIIRGDA